MMGQCLGAAGGAAEVVAAGEACVVTSGVGSGAGATVATGAVIVGALRRPSATPWSCCDLAQREAASHATKRTKSDADTEAIHFHHLSTRACLALSLALARSMSA